MLKYVALALAMIIVGTSVTVSRFLSLELPIFLTALLRFSVAMVFLLPFVPGTLRRLSNLNKRTYRVLIAQAFFGVAFFSVTLLYGVRYIDANKAGIITATTPAIIYLLSIFVLGEKRNRYHDSSIVLAVMALLILNIDTSTNVDSSAYGMVGIFLGGLLVLMAVFGEALFTIFRKPIADTVSPLDNTVAVIFFALLMMIGPGLWDASQQKVSLELQHIVAIVYMGALVTVLAFMLWFYGVGKVPAKTASSFTALMPISAVYSASLMLEESLEWNDGVALLLVLSGIHLGSRAERQSKAPIN